MRLKLKTILAGAAAVALTAGGLAGCSSGGDGDLEACEAFNVTMAGAPNMTDEREAAAFVAAGANEAAQMATSQGLAENLELFGAGFAAMANDTSAGNLDFYQVAISLKKVVAKCGAVGAEIPNLKTVTAEMGLDDLTVEDWEELRDWEEKYGNLGEGTVIDEDETESGGSPASESAVVGGDEEENAEGTEGSESPHQSFDYDFGALEEEAEKIPALFEPRTACLEGDMGACDVLYDMAPDGSETKRFAAECGGFKVGGTGGTCTQ